MDKEEVEFDNVFDFKKKIDEEKLRLAAKVIRNGGVVVFPTETVYGIGANSFDDEAIEKLYKIKKRPHSKPISLLVSNFNMIKDVCDDISNLEYKIMKNFFPGPLTIILKKNKNLSDKLTSGTDTVGIRMPDNYVALKLIEDSKTPIATSSANITGKPSGTNIKSIKKDFKDSVDIFIDTGESKIGQASTIVKVDNGKVIILREGKITKKQILKCLSK